MNFVSAQFKAHLYNELVSCKNETQFVSLNLSNFF